MVYRAGALDKRQQREWANISAKAKRHGIKVKRSGYATVYPDGTTVQLGSGRATEVMNARIIISKREGRRYVNRAK